MNVRSPISSFVANAANSALISFERGRLVADKIHLVDREHQVRHPQQGGQEGVPAALLGQSLPRVHEDDRQVGGRGARHHVARVLNMAGRVGDDEFAAGGREVAVGDVDGDALLTLGPQPIGQQRQIRVFLTTVAAGPLDGLKLILEDRF